MKKKRSFILLETLIYLLIDMLLISIFLSVPYNKYLDSIFSQIKILQAKIYYIKTREASTHILKSLNNYNWKTLNVIYDYGNKRIIFDMGKFSKYLSAKMNMNYIYFFKGKPSQGFSMFVEDYEISVIPVSGAITTKKVK